MALWLSPAAIEAMSQSGANPTDSTSVEFSDSTGLNERKATEKHQQCSVFLPGSRYVERCTPGGVSELE